MKIGFTLLLFLFCNFIVYAQIDDSPEKIESLLTQIREEPSDTIKVNLLIDVANLTVDADTSLIYLKSALSLAKKIYWEKGIAEVYYNIGWIYLTEAKLQEARENMLKAAELEGDIGTRIHAYGIASNISIWAKDKDKAYQYAQDGLDLAIKNNAPEDVLGNARVYLADAYSSEKDMKNMIRNCIIAMGHYEKSKHELGLSISLMYLFHENIEIDYISYTFYLQKVYDRSKINDRRNYTLSLFKMASAYFELKQYEKEREKQIIIYVSILGFLMLISGFLLWQNHSRKKMNAKLQVLNNNLDTQNQIKANILGVLNHDLRHPVARLINYLQLKAKAPESIDADMAARMESQTMQMSKSLLQNIEELLIWSKDEMSNHKLDIQPVEVASLFEEMKNFFDYENTVKIEFSNPQNLCLMTDALHLEVIMRNLTANAINATKDKQKPLVVWSAHKEDNGTVLSIKDNGNGMSDENIRKFYEESTPVSGRGGLGTHIIRDLSKKIECKIEIKSEADKGTIIDLIFPD